jgi:hypothetical protein
MQERGEANSLKKEHSSATIVADVKRFAHQINTDKVFGKHSRSRVTCGLCQLSRKPLSILDRLGFFSFLTALASIWRMRSRVNENCLPTSSSV